MPRVQITHCPECNYSLHGLPREHRCPECGLFCDENTVFWRPSRHSAWILILAFNLLVLSLMALKVLSQGVRGSAPSAIDSLGSLLFLAAIVFLWYQNYRTKRHGRYIVINRHGLHFRNTGKTKFVPWSEMQAVDSNDGSEPVRIPQRAEFDLNQLLPVADDFFEFKESLNKAMLKYRQIQVLENPT